MHALDGSAHIAHALYAFDIQLVLLDEKLADGDRRDESVHLVPQPFVKRHHKQGGLLNFICSTNLLFVFFWEELCDTDNWPHTLETSLLSLDCFVLQ
jgi:hypothetical protein